MTALLVGCAGSDAVTVSDAGDAAPADAGAATDVAMNDVAAPDSGACNELALEGAEVTATGVQGSPTAPSGGTIADGRYRLTAFAVFYPSAPAPPTTTLTSSVEVSGTTMRSVGRSTPRVFSTTATFGTAGTTLTLDYTCPSGVPAGAAQYTASPTQLILYFAQGALTLVQTYTRM